MNRKIEKLLIESGNTKRARANIIEKEIKKQTKRLNYLEQGIYKEVAKFIGISEFKEFIPFKKHSHGEQDFRMLLKNGEGFDINNSVVMNDILHNTFGIPFYGEKSLKTCKIKELAMQRREDGSRFYPIIWKLYNYKVVYKTLNCYLIPMKEQVYSAEYFSDRYTLARR